MTRAPCSLMLLAFGCQPDLDAKPGPTFGGSTASEAESPSAFLAHHPVDVAEGTCKEAICVETRIAVLPDDRWLVALGVEGMAPTQPTGDLIMALDLSGSVQTSSDVRAAVVEIAAEQLVGSAGIVGFRGTPQWLLEPTEVDMAEQVTEVLRAIDRSEAFTNTIRDSTPLALGTDLCVADPHEVALFLGDCAAFTDAWSGVPDAQRPTHECGMAWEWIGTDDVQEAIDIWEELGQLRQGRNLLLGPGIQQLACTDGTDVEAALKMAYHEAPDATPWRASRVLLVSDLEGGAKAVDIVSEGAKRFVGLTVMGVTAGMDTHAARTLAAQPGALFLGGDDPAGALAAWELGFDRFLEPRAWSMQIAVDEAFTINEVFGATDESHTGINAVFASTDHGVVGLVVTPPSDPRWMTTTLTYQLPGGPQTIQSNAHVPLGLLHTDFGGTDHAPVLKLAARKLIFEAITEGGMADDDANEIGDFAKTWSDDDLVRLAGLFQSGS